MINFSLLVDSLDEIILQAVVTGQIRGIARFACGESDRGYPPRRLGPVTAYFLTSQPGRGRGWVSPSRRR